jgi:hypothetical protein
LDAEREGVSSLRIIVDADGCPGKDVIIRIAKNRGIEVLLVADHNHRLEDGYSSVLYVDPGRDAADIALVNQISPGDVVVTQDYGVASMGLARGAFPVHPIGYVFDEDNIGQLMFERFLGQEARRSGKRTKGPRPRTKVDDQKLAACLASLLPEEKLI